MAVCEVCDTPLSADAKFCPACGHPVTAAADAQQAPSAGQAQAPAAVSGAPAAETSPGSSVPPAAFPSPAVAASVPAAVEAAQPATAATPQPAATAQAASAPAAATATPAPTEAPPTTPTPPKKKGRTGCIVAAVIVALLLCCVASTVGVLFYMGVQKAADQRKALETANAAFEKGATDVNSALAKLDAVDPMKVNAAKLQPTVDSVKALSASAAAQIQTASAAIESLDDSKGKTAYQQALASVSQIPPQMDAMGAALLTAARITDIAYRGDKAYVAGMKALDAGTVAGNNNQYDLMSSKNQEAAKQFTAAETAYREAAKLDPAAGYDKDALQAELRLQQAQLSVRMAADGKAGRTTAYNAGVATDSALRTRARSVSILDSKARSVKIKAKAVALAAQIEKELTAAKEALARAEAAFKSE